VSAKVILKYPVPKSARDGRFDMKVPMNSNPLHFGHDRSGTLCLWVECFADSARAFQESDHHETRPFKMILTGDAFELDGEHFQTIIVDRTLDTLVGHIYALAGPRYTG
jgi:hypothetical protein